MGEISRSKTALVILLCFANVFAQTGHCYVVKEGDTLSHVVHKNIPGRLFGKKGSLARVLKLNPQIKNQHRIYPGQEIHFEVEPAHRAIASVPTASPEVVAEIQGPVQDIPGSIAFSLIPSFKFTELRAVDRSTGGVARLNSSFHLDLAAHYEQQWSPSVKSYLGFSLGYFTPEKSTDVRKAFVDASKVTSGISFGVQTPLSEKTKLDLSVHYRKDLFIRAISSTQVTVDEITAPGFDAKIGYDLLKVSRLTLGVQAVSGVTLPSSTESYTTRLGVVYGGNIYIAHGKNVETSVGFLKRSQNTSLTNQSETNFSLNAVFRFGGDKP